MLFGDATLGVRSRKRVTETTGACPIYTPQPWQGQLVALISLEIPPAAGT